MLVDTSIARPNGVILTPDQSQLVVADTNGRTVYIFQIQPDGKLALKQPYFTHHLPDWMGESGADGMTVDAQGRLYVATKVGLEVFDQAGKVNAIISRPQNAWLSNAAFGGKDLDTLYVTSATLRRDPSMLAGQNKAGGLFAIRGLGVKGLPLVPFKG